MSHRRRSGIKKFFAGMVIGSLAAGVSALLFAPKSGDKVRKSIKKQYRTASDKAQDLVSDVSDCMMEAWDKASVFMHEAKESVADVIKEFSRK